MPRSRDELSRLYRDLYSPVLTFFRNRGFSPEEAEELAQETFLQAHRGWTGFRGEAERRSWVYGIAKNLWRNELRDRGREKRSAQEDSLEELTEEKRARLPTTEDAGQPSPHETAVANEQLRAVRAGMGDLSPVQREALLLQTDQGLKYHEIAAVLKIPMGSVRSLLHQARRKLKRYLKRRFGRNGY